MYAEERRRELVQLARSEGRVQVSAVAERLDVTPETIRRDLEVLDRQGLLRRVHGGAMPSDLLLLTDLALVEREATAAAQKERIATAALEQLPAPGGSILLDAGSTTGRLAALLPAGNRLAVFTHCLPIAAALSARTDAEVHLLGGRVKGITQACVGAATVTELSRLCVDVCFVAANGLGPERGLSTPDSEEGLVKAQLVRSARRVVALVDSRKFGVEATRCFAGLDEIDVLITDAITPHQLTQFTRHGIEVVVA